MTEKQKIFCQAYIANHYNATRAYLEAYPGSSYNTANSQPTRLLKKQEIRDYIAELQREAVQQYGDIAALISQQLVEDITYRDEDGNHSAGWQKSVDLLSKNLGLQKQDISVKQTTITVDIDE